MAALTSSAMTAYIILGPTSAAALLSLGASASLCLGLGRTLGARSGRSSGTTTALGFFLTAAATLGLKGLYLLGLIPNVEVPRTEVPCEAAAVAKAGG